METLLIIVLVVAAFIAGVLFGRANPKKADKIAEVAKDTQETVKLAIRKR